MLDFREYYDSKYSRGPQGFAPAFPRQMRFLLKWMQLPSRPLRIVDLGGGTGEYSLMLQDMGNDVTLFEISEVAVDRARQLGVKKTRLGDFLHEPPEGSFDLVFAKGFSPLNTDDPPRFASVLERMKGLLAPNGVVLYWGVTNFTGSWSSSGWFNWKAEDLGRFFDELLVMPLFRYQAVLPVSVNRGLSRVVCHARTPRALSLLAFYRDRNAARV